MTHDDFQRFSGIIKSNYGDCEVIYVCQYMEWNEALGGYQCSYRRKCRESVEEILNDIVQLNNCPGKKEENGRKICCKLKKL